MITRTHLHLLNSAIVLPLLLAGCVTAPAPLGETYSATYVGDRQSLALKEVVLTVMLQEETNPHLQNLHVGLEAIVNPKDLSLASTYEVTGIIRRLEPRIRSRLSELVAVGKLVSFQTLPGLKQEIARAAHSTFSASYSKWTKATAFDVQIVVASYYLTDLSVGAQPGNRAGWW